MTAGILTFVWLVWPLVTLAGGLGFAPLAGLMALVLAPLAVPRLRPRFYMLGIVAFFGWAAFTSTWSPRQLPLVEFDFANGDFAVRSEMLRVGLLVPAIGLLLAAVPRLDQRRRDRILRIAGWAFAAQAVIVLLLAAFEQSVLDFLTPWIPDHSEGVQNISRNCLVMALAAPFLVMGLAEGRKPWIAAGLMAAVVVIEGVILTYRGVHGGLLALFAAALSIGVIAIWRTSGFRILGVGLALLVWTAPMFFGLLALDTDVATAATSSEWRLAIWNRVIEVTAERPFEGSGLGVLRTIDDVIPDGPLAGMPLVPNHAHNMLLQLWAETGAIGAGLLAIAIMLAAWRLPAPERLGVAAPRLAGLIGGTAAIACVSFDLWNEWWWAVVGLLGVLCAVATPEQDETAPPPAPKPRQIGFEPIAPYRTPLRALSPASDEGGR